MEPGAQLGAARVFGHPRPRSVRGLLLLDVDERLVGRAADVVVEAGLERLVAAALEVLLALLLLLERHAALGFALVDLLLGRDLLRRGLYFFADGIRRR